MTFREKIARWISPNLARQADKFHYLWHQADDCHRWLSEFADVALAAQWLKERDLDHWRTLEEPATGKLPSNIVDFREFLRSRQNPAPQSSVFRLQVEASKHAADAETVRRERDALILEVARLRASTDLPQYKPIQIDPEDAALLNARNYTINEYIDAARSDKTPSPQPNVNADINSAGDGWIQVTLSGDGVNDLKESTIERALSAHPPVHNKQLSTLIEESKAHYDTMTPEEKAAMWQAQRESFVRGMTTPCEHGVLDFEQCPDCRNPAPKNRVPARDAPEYANAEAAFTAYFVRNYPGPDTVIFDPKWHAPKLFAAAVHAIRDGDAA